MSMHFDSKRKEPNATTIYISSVDIYVVHVPSNRAHDHGPGWSYYYYDEKGYRAQKPFYTRRSTGVSDAARAAAGVKRFHW